MEKNFTAFHSLFSMSVYRFEQMYSWLHYNDILQNDANTGLICCDVSSHVMNQVLNWPLKTSIPIKYAQTEVYTNVKATFYKFCADKISGFPIFLHKNKQVQVGAWNWAYYRRESNQSGFCYSDFLRIFFLRKNNFKLEIMIAKICDFLFKFYWSLCSKLKIWQQ